MFEKLKRRWDSYCNGCGQCCCEKYPKGFYSSAADFPRGRLAVNRKYFIDFSRTCRFFNIESGQCFVYDRRFKECPSCIPMTIFRALFAGFLPEECGYVIKFRPWLRWKSK